MQTSLTNWYRDLKKSTTCRASLLIGAFLLLLLPFFSYSSEIKWYSFEEGLSLAKRQNKLVFMDIYAKWCHWCNVIENTTYRDKRVIDLINRYYIPVRVDAEERPDINKRYNQGGLPSTVILTPDGKILFGAIYVSPDEMVKVLKYYASLPPEKLEKIKTQIERKRNFRQKLLTKLLKEKDLNPTYLKKLFRYITIRYDYQYGGLKGAPKFPKTDLVYFLFDYWLVFDDDKAKILAKQTLDAYSYLRDKEEGGIYRYSVNEYWTEFHYEKLLKDQANLAVLYYDGYSVFQDKKYLTYANLLLSFAINKLYNQEEGLFYNSQGADIIDENGTLLMTGEEYFVKSRKERKQIQEELGYAPNIEKNFFSSTNLLMVSALVYAAAFNKNQDYLTKAKNLLSTIEKVFLTKEGIQYSQKGDYYLASQVYYLEALLNLYQLTGDLTYLKKAKNFLQILDKYYYNTKLGIYTDLKDTGLNLKNISFIDDLFTLNAKLVNLLYRVSLFSEDEKIFERAKKLTKKLPTKANISTGIAYFTVLVKPLSSRLIGNNLPLKSKFYVFRMFPFFHYSQPIDNPDLAKKLDYPFSKNPQVYICNIDMCFTRLNELIHLKTEIRTIYKRVGEVLMPDS